MDDDGERKHRSAANAVGGSTARACDGCLRRRARWYCGADDAFLCQACDSSVHSANPLARRHQRLRLHTASASFPSSSSSSPLNSSPSPISWRRRKARTPRAYKFPKVVKPEPLVPDLEKEEEDLEMQLMYSVPVLETAGLDDLQSTDVEAKSMEMEMEEHMLSFGMDLGVENLDIESLLGVGFDDVHESSLFVDEEDVGGIKMEFDFDAMGDEIELYGETQEGVGVEEEKGGELSGGFMKKMGLRLDYDAVIDAWSRSGCSQWAWGGRPQFDPDGYLPSMMVIL